ncbi:hypothetical protein OG568_51375 (plasmid) [Streptomyces sp. NBC_01450]|uniref:hypothetical protein n=1 Tax=Streptomyces sp. NBC_01450 TaxID=2903871 RepID=UPI002E31F86E|nr:hypothetical protein [Streptomyces sp. NBC_01450]
MVGDQLLDLAFQRAQPGLAGQQLVGEFADQLSGSAFCGDDGELGLCGGVRGLRSGCFDSVPTQIGRDAADLGRSDGLQVVFDTMVEQCVTAIIGDRDPVSPSR